MFPGSAKFQTRPASPQFTNFSPPADYPPHSGLTPLQQQQLQQQQQLAIGIHGSTLNSTNFHHQQQQHQQHSHNHAHTHTHQPQQHPPHTTSSSAAATAASMSMRHPKSSMSASKTRSQSGHHLVNSTNTMSANSSSSSSGGGGNGAGNSSGSGSGSGCSSGGMLLGAGSLGHHRGELIFPDDMDSIEFCMPPPPAAMPTNGYGHGSNGGADMLLMHATDNSLCDAAFTEQRRRRNHSRRSNHKMDVEQQVKWSRKNIAATMERFEPTTHSSSSASSLEYGFAAGVVSPSGTGTPAHHAQLPAQSQQAYNSAGTPYNNHVYSYAYYEPGAIKCHTNVPQEEGATALPIHAAPSKSPPRNSIRALLAKGFRSKSSNGQSTSSSPSTDERHTYTTRYGTTENLYEEVNEQKIRKVLSDNRITANTHVNVKEELRRVQHNHFRVLDELNLSLEALIMPPTPPDVSPNHVPDDDEPTTSGAAAAAANAAAVALQSANTQQRTRRGGLLGGASTSSAASSQQRTLSHASLENLSTTLNSMELKDHAQSACINPEFDEGDLDSGFSGSGSSSGASYNESLRYYKTGNGLHMQTTTLPHNVRSCRSSTASGTSTSKSSMASQEDHHGLVGMMTGMMGGCGVAATTVGNAMLASPFDYARRCSDTQRASARSITPAGAAATGAKPKKNFWTLKP